MQNVSNGQGTGDKKNVFFHPVPFNIRVARKAHKIRHAIDKNDNFFWKTQSFFSHLSIVKPAGMRYTVPFSTLGRLERAGIP